MAISAEAVAEAAERLLERGRTPTLRAVREALGGGSFGTIAPLLRRWDEGRRARDAAATTMPPAVAQAHAAASAMAWQAALAAAAEVQRESLAQHSATIAETQGRLEEALTIIRGLEADLAQAHATRDRMAQELATRTAEIAELARVQHQLAETNAELGAQLRLLEERRATVDQERAHLARDLTEERAQRAVSDRQRREAETQAATAAQARDQALAQLQELQVAHERAATAAERARAQERAQAAQVADALREQVARADAQLEDVQERLAAEADAHARTRTAIAQEVNAARQVQDDLRRQLAEAQAQLQAAQARERAALDRAQDTERVLAQLTSLGGAVGERLQALERALGERPPPREGRG